MDYETYKKNGRFSIFHKPIIRKECHYKNVRFLFPYEKPNNFHAELAVYTTENIIIANSNSYIDDSGANASEAYEEKHRIYSRLNYTYDQLCNKEPEECIEEAVCSFMSPFDSVNFGHNLSVVFDFIHQYRALELKIPIVLSNVSKNFPNILRVLELFFEDIRFIENNKMYLFKEIYFFTPIILDVCRHPTIIQETITRSLKHVGLNGSYKNKKVFIVKLMNHHANIVETNTAFHSDTLLEKLRNDPGWVVIQPESMSIYDIIAYLQHASFIVTSVGAISYGHGIFFNRESTLYFLSQETVPKAYQYINWMRYVFVTKYLDNHIDTIYKLRPEQDVLVKKNSVITWLRKP